MKSLVFDSSTIITLVTNNLLWILKPLKEKFNGEFFITEEVKKELVDVPLKTKRFKFEAITILDFLTEGKIKLAKEDISKRTDKLLFLANHIFKAKDNWIRIVHRGEVEALALASHLEADAFVVDERTLRLLIENPKRLAKLLNKKLHTRIDYDLRNLRDFQKEIGKMNVLRSVDLMVLAYETGLLDKYINKEELRKSLLEGVLWGVKLKGCSVSVKEINEIIKLEGF